MPFVILPAFVADKLSPSADRKGSRLHVDGSSVDDVFRYLMHHHAVACERIFTASGEVRRNVVVAVNDELVSRTGSPVPLNENDEVCLLVQFAGG
jgi:hypothetical protein